MTTVTNDVTAAALARLLAAAPLADDYRLAITVMCNGMPDDMHAACEELRAARAEAYAALAALGMTSTGDQPTPGDEGDHVPSDSQTRTDADVPPSTRGDGLTTEGSR